MEWLYDKQGQPVAVYYANNIYWMDGQHLAWLNQQYVYGCGGSCVGWYELGALYDTHNQLRAVRRDATAFVPEKPVDFAKAPAIPTLASAPSPPAYLAPQKRASFRGWSLAPALEMFGIVAS